MDIKRFVKSVVVNSDFLSDIRHVIEIQESEVAHKKRVKAFKETSNSERIRDLKDSVLGERCFIIGNGPSLRAKDLDKLKNEYTFAANRIWLMYERTEWRPSYYMCQDWQMIKTEQDRIKKYEGLAFVGFDGMFEQGITIDNAIGYLCDKRPYVKRQLPLPFSYDCAEYVVDGSIVTYSAIQLAMYMGFKEIYLLGVDNNYQYTIDKNRKITEHSEVKDSHFDPRYKELALQANKNKIFGISDPEMSDGAYLSANDAAKKMGVKIYNATRGGKLEFYERKDFDTITFK